MAFQVIPHDDGASDPWGDLSRILLVALRMAPAAVVIASPQEAEVGLCVIALPIVDIRCLHGGFVCRLPALIGTDGVHAAVGVSDDQFAQIGYPFSVVCRDEAIPPSGSRKGGQDVFPLMEHGGHVIGAVVFPLCHFGGAGLQLMVSDLSILPDRPHPLAVDEVLIYPQGGGIQPCAGDLFGNVHRTPEYGKTVGIGIRGFHGADPFGIAEALLCGQGSLKGCGCADEIFLLIPNAELPCVWGRGFQALSPVNDFV